MKFVKPLNKLAIGTVQFGCSYGVSNKTGKVSIDSAKEILAYAKDAEIDVLDTAIAYGDSELCLGQIGIDNWKVVSKLSELPSGVDNIQKWAKDSLQGSLSRLKIPKLYGLLLHRP
ncbi:MAG: aldo/keto reductase, partial [Pseudanabaena sp.]